MTKTVASQLTTGRESAVPAKRSHEPEEGAVRPLKVRGLSRATRKSPRRTVIAMTIVPGLGAVHDVVVAAFGEGEPGGQLSMQPGSR